MMRIFSAFFAASFLLLPGCADDAPAGRNDPVPPACEGQQYGLTVTDPPTAVLRLTYQQTGTVSFRYTDCTGAPLAGYQVNFSAAGATAGAVLQAASAPTDADGVAIATVQSSDAETDFDLKASALNAPDASARISVRSKDGGDLEVRLVYRGRKQLQGARVLAVAAPLDCATLDPALPPTALELKDVQSLRDKVRFTLSGEPSVALIAIGKGSTAAPAAVGCLAGPVAIKNGAKEVKEVELVDVKPSYAGTYDVTNNFNLVKILPEGIGFYIEQLGNLFQNPGATAVEWLKNAPGVRDTPGVGTFLDGVGGDLVGDLANEAFATYTEGTPLGDAFSMGAEIDDILRKLEIISTWSILEEPGEDGKFGPDTIEERWDALVITWTTGVCEGDDAAEGCGRNEYAWAGGETLLDPVEARPTGSISADNPFLMTVDPHGIKFDTGKIAMFIIEKVVLPRLTMAGCERLETYLASSYDRWVKDLGSTAEGKKKLPGEIRKFLCFPGSDAWPCPARYDIAVGNDARLFAMVLALSEMLPPTDADGDRMRLAGKGPKDRLYGMFQIGSQHFWLWPYFEPRGKNAIPSGLVKLGTNVMSAFDDFCQSEDHLKAAEAWVQWWEENWSTHLNKVEVEAAANKAIATFTRRQAKVTDPAQNVLWEQFKQAVQKWRDEL